LIGQSSASHGYRWPHGRVICLLYAVDVCCVFRPWERLSRQPSPGLITSLIVISDVSTVVSWESSRLPVDRQNTSMPCLNQSRTADAQQMAQFFLGLKDERSPSPIITCLYPGLRPTGRIWGRGPHFSVHNCPAKFNVQ
jgi:hypothetical protein